MTPSELMAAIAKLAAREPTIVAFDGLAGSGKTTIANAARRASGGRAVIIVATDAFYQPDLRNWRSWTPEQGYERYFDHVRLESELLRPLRQRRTARFPLSIGSIALPGRAVASNRATRCCGRRLPA